MVWETIIGIEIHAELKTNSKIFCNCPTKFGAEKNKNTCPVCIGLPGTLPRLNKETIHLAIKAGLSFNCKINNFSKMDRKNYFYPDTPKAYQVSQNDKPICFDGFVDINKGADCVNRIRINRIHIEEDAGKLVHLEREPHTLIDYNRAGIPLIEIVSEPDLRSPTEAVEYVKAIKNILMYQEISDCRMEEGSLRCDANISIRKKGEYKLNTKVELKNINSFKELQKALENEEQRQKELYINNQMDKVMQETRRWDSVKGKTISMRKKEESQDYRYFPEPDIPIITIDKSWINCIKKQLSEFPNERKIRYINNYRLKEKDAELLTSDKALGNYFEKIVASGADPKTTVNWILGDFLKLLKANEISVDQVLIKESDFAELINLIKREDISQKIGKVVFKIMFLTGKRPKVIIEEKGLKQIKNKDALEKIVNEVLTSNTNPVNDYYEGKTQAIGYLMGQIMKETNGQANPQLSKELLLLKLSCKEYLPIHNNDEQ
ncbi:Asp-tRNA(Asn)/Glu-tRNA(Gln) amidotransferase subunit GatB [Serpentinicella sp. ANB-PHB4]|uniref:Asp-tRNA(Asn)/Glu-tRNA(Gln) amidotransferase subunit GatB n=1 Tax=Serpentinicella sp. ANB-PHB4 TaxID=3074076 RepID=UPI002865446B|nr:Asp-tRNA(Asn)/Glu-tRNA(Gln) amidotransferase subunit GatB [Serpentinicella sp. ANB-PHB4]MDR5658085.1 Asp-tRNA(Asn)/Glu-tRNA(Gln) amidotransferase subunit GatB [Serpentinicella sp. ANB-PHB4]